jgi:lipid-binding SYLF domain-containing protein
VNAAQQGVATSLKENIMTSNRITAAAKLVVAAGAIAVGAMAFAPGAQAETFEHSCTTNPGAYATNAVTGVFHTERRDFDRDQICKVYNAGNKLLGTTIHTDYGYYKNPKHLGEQQQVPPPAAQVRQ